MDFNAEERESKIFVSFCQSHSISCGRRKQDGRIVWEAGCTKERNVDRMKKKGRIESTVFLVFPLFC
jgi:hypothetical protein